MRSAYDKAEYSALRVLWLIFKVPNCVEGFIKAKFPNVPSNKAYIGHYKAEEQAVVCVKADNEP